jgi:hypothetical protein
MAVPGCGGLIATLGAALLARAASLPRAPRGLRERGLRMGRDHERTQDRGSRPLLTAAWCLNTLAVAAVSVTAAAQDAGELAKAAQNPVAAMISLPLQNNLLFGIGPDDDVANVLNWTCPLGVEGSLTNPSTPGGQDGGEADPTAVHD